MIDDMIEDEVELEVDEDLEGRDERGLFVVEVVENTTVLGVRISIGTGFISISFEYCSDRSRLELRDEKRTKKKYWKLESHTTTKHNSIKYCTWELSSNSPSARAIR